MNTTKEYQHAEAWMNGSYPFCKKADVDWTFEKCEFPDHVRKWIVETWTKIDDKNGGTYVKPAMNDVNQEALRIMTNQGPDAAFKFMTVDQKTGRQLSYSEIRARFG